jgi:hypothetical protein
MASWRDAILKEFTPEVSRLTLVADPDGLLAEEEVLAGIRERGFDLIPFEDPVAFRFVYESRYRARWDRGGKAELVVVLRAPPDALRALPFDLLQTGRQLSFSLDDLLPTFSGSIVRELDRGDLDALYHAQGQYGYQRLGANATKAAVLRHVFGIIPELIQEPAHLLRTLLRRHYRAFRVPRVLEEWLIQTLVSSGRFTEWPLAQTVTDREAFFAFLQERWPAFLDEMAGSQEATQERLAPGYGLQIPGPVQLPFDHPDIRIYVDNLFLEGHLRPVDHVRAPGWKDTWAAVGLRIDPRADRTRRFRRLFAAVEQHVPGEEARHREWLTFAMQWAKLLALRYSDELLPISDLAQPLEALHEQVEERFAQWMLQRYGGLYNQPATPPVMVHHLPRYLARRVAHQDAQKVAMVVMDGLAMDQWMVLRESLAESRPEFEFREEAVFAWVPTLTSISRQAIFAGTIPMYFAGSLLTTYREPDLWKQFWADEGLTPGTVGYDKGLGDGSLTAVEELASQPKVRVLGLVVDIVDRIMHGMTLGTRGMHNQVRQWTREGYLARLLDLLIQEGFDVHLTSDHGNIEASGIGNPGEGVLADIRGARARIYPSATLRRQAHQQFPTTLEWPSLGLPEDRFSLLAAGRGAFISPDQRTVSHGGISLEEVIVTLIWIGRKEHS